LSAHDEYLADLPEHDRDRLVTALRKLTPKEH
jgi:hypothetical protein